MPLEYKLIYTVCVCAMNAGADACTRRVIACTMVREREKEPRRKRGGGREREKRERREREREDIDIYRYRLAWIDFCVETVGRTQMIPCRCASGWRGAW
jgi:hypothetical protein